MVPIETFTKLYQGSHVLRKLLGGLYRCWNFLEENSLEACGQVQN